jgi:predicted nucleic acid-binding protein
MKTGPRTIEEATELLHRLSRHPGYRFWPMTAEWSVLAAPFRERLFGHQQITDAYLLGLAVKENGILVTLDRGLSYLAGAQYSGNLLVLE